MTFNYMYFVCFYFRFYFVVLGREYRSDKQTKPHQAALPRCQRETRPTCAPTQQTTCTIHLSERQAGPSVALHVEPRRHDVVVPETRNVEKLAGLQHRLEGRGVGEALSRSRGKRGTRGRGGPRGHTCCGYPLPRHLASLGEPLELKGWDTPRGSA